MGSKHLAAGFAFATGLVVAGPAYAFSVVDDGAVTVPENAPTSDVDPNITAQSNASTVTFAGAETAANGYIQALAAGAITFGGTTTASGSITATSTGNGAVVANGGLVAGGAVFLNAGTGDVTLGALSLGAPSSITGANVTLTGALTVPSSLAGAELTIVAGTRTTATITLNLAPTAAALGAGSRLHVFTWSGPSPRTVTATLGTAPVLAAGLKYGFADLAIDGDIVVVAACGDHVLDPGEACDDGNVTPGDGCSATCTVEPVVVDAGSDGGHGGDAGDAGDAGLDATVEDAGDSGDGAVPSGSATASAPPELGDIFGDDGSSCAFAPGGLAAPLSGAAGGAALVALGALLRRRRARAR